MIDPDETKDINLLIDEVIDDKSWIDQPNSQFDLKTPRSLIGTDWEIHLRNVLRAIKHGMFS